MRKPANDLYCLVNLRVKIKRKEEERNKQEGERKRSVERGGDDASGHEVSLVTAVTEKATIQP